MNCPLCDSRAPRSGGGTIRADNTRLKYYRCPECDTTFSVDRDNTIRILSDEPVMPYKSTRQMLKVLRSMIRDDQDWFSEVQPDTQEFARQVVRRLNS